MSKKSKSNGSNGNINQDKTPLLDTLLSHARSGQVRVLASTGPTRNAAAPDVPVIAEYVPGYEVVSTQALFVPTIMRMMSG